MFSKESVLNSLIALLIVFVVGYGSVVSIHYAFSNIISNLDGKIKNEQARYQIGEYILTEISKIEKQYYQMTMAFKLKELKPLQSLIEDEIEDIHHAINVLENGGTLTKYIDLNIPGIHKSTEYITYTPDREVEYTFEAIDLKPKLLVLQKKVLEMEEVVKMKAQIHNMKSIEKRNEERFKIKIFYKELPTTFIRMKENASRLLYESKQALLKHQETINKEKLKYGTLEVATTVIVFLLMLIFGYAVVQQILKKSRELEKLTQKANEANETKSRFLANMSHEIRTPLNAIIGFSEILTKSQTMNEEDKEKANIIVKSSKALLLIINDILDISKVESGKLELSLEYTNMYNLLNNIVELYEINAKQKDIHLHFDYDGELPQIILCDETRLKQVLSNILSNAIKFTKTNGNVTLKVYLLEKENNKAIIRFSIKDEGIGISMENQKKIFDPFTQADSGISRKFGGTGLGLSISMKIINLMGSKIQLISQKDQGSTFYFDVEFTYDENQTDLNITPTNIASNIKDTKLSGEILVAEDNTNNQLLIKLLLQDQGMNVTIANNGKEAVEFFEKKSYDLVFLDINMPVMDGLTALQEIKKFEENKEIQTPTIALTANSLKGDREKYLQAGMDDYLSKPIDSSKLQIILQRYCLHKQSKPFNEKPQLDINIKNFSTQYGISEDTATLMIENIKKEIEKELELIQDTINKQEIQQTKTHLKNLEENCINLSFETLSNELQDLILLDDIKSIETGFIKIKSLLDSL
jgi:signal transduction histidine kinase/CheY-like chemotaxis protein